MNVTMSLPISIALALCRQQPVSIDLAPSSVPSRTPAFVVPAGSMQTLLDVEDLLSLEFSAKDDPNETLEQRKLKATLPFAGILHRWMKPAFTPEADRLEVVAPGRIALTATGEQIAWAQRFCEYQRTVTDLVDVQAHILDLPKGTLKSLGIEGPTKTFDKESDFEALLARLKDREGTNLLSSPRLTASPRNQVSLSVGDSVAYVADWRLEIVEPGPQSIPVPTIETVFDGRIIECRAVPLEEGLDGLELKFTSSRLVRPIPTKKLRIGSGEGKEVEVGLPEVKKIGVDTRISLADGASILFGVLSAEEGREVALTVTMRRIKLGLQPR